MADPNSFRSMLIVNRIGGNEASIAVSDFDSRKHLVLQAPIGAGDDWTPPDDKAPLGERMPVEWADAPPGEAGPDEAGRPAKPIRTALGKVGDKTAPQRAQAEKDRIDAGEAGASQTRAARGPRGRS